MNMPELTDKDRTALADYVAQARSYRLPLSNELEQTLVKIMSHTDVRKLDDTTTDYDQFLIAASFAVMKIWHCFDNKLLTPSEAFDAIENIKSRLPVAPTGRDRSEKTNYYDYGNVQASL